MDKHELQKLRNLPIEGVAERLGLRMMRGHKSLCPFHDDHNASLSFHVSKNTCRCFVCMDTSMGTIDLVMKHLRLNFKEACRWLANAHNVILDEWKPATTNTKTVAFDASRYERFFLHPWLTHEAQQFLFAERRLHRQVVDWCKITSWRDRQGTNWLQTPFFYAEENSLGCKTATCRRAPCHGSNFPTAANAASTTSLC